MKNVRQSVFETNSSSTHAVSIGDTDSKVLNDLPRLDDNGNFVMTVDGEYGWGYETYNGVYTKIDYMARQAENDDLRLNVLKDIIKEYTGAKKVYFIFDYGYIDHQSNGSFNGLFDPENKEKLVTFLFNPESTLIISNDNGGTDGWEYYDDEKEDWVMRPEYENYKTSI